MWMLLKVWMEDPGAGLGAGDQLQEVFPFQLNIYVRLRVFYIFRSKQQIVCKNRPEKPVVFY